VGIEALPVVSFTTYSHSYRGNPRGAIMFPFQGIYQAREFYKPDYENNDSKILTTERLFIGILK